MIPRDTFLSTLHTHPPALAHRNGRSNFRVRVPLRPCDPDKWFSDALDFAADLSGLAPGTGLELNLKFFNERGESHQ